MKPSDASTYRCPKCGGGLELVESSQTNGEDVVEGNLACTGCKATHPIVRSLPRFVAPENYAGNFGYQWNAYARTQIGGSQKDLSKYRWDLLTHWKEPNSLSGLVMLEAGCGAGRFSEIALDTGAELWSFDLSSAVEAAKNNIPEHHKPRHHLAQASIYSIPFPHAMFDRLYCMGVLQHTPDVKKSFMSLVPFLKPGGEMAIDCYRKKGWKEWATTFNRFDMKYWFRPFVKWWPPALLRGALTVAVSTLFEIKSAVSKVPGIGKPIANWIPIGALSYEPDQVFTRQELKQIKVLSALDMLGPAYDYPQTFETVKAWAAEAGLEIIEIFDGFNGINCRLRKPLSAPK